MARQFKKRGDDESTNPPTHVIKMKPANPEEKGWTQVGVAWIGTTKKGVKYYNMKLERGTSLHWEQFTDGGSYVLQMYPNDGDKYAARQR